MNFTEASKVAQNLKHAYPGDTFLAISVTPNKNFGWNILDFGGWRVYKLAESNGNSISDDQVKEKALCWMFDSKSITDVEKRKNFIYEKMKNIFPAHKVNVFLFRESDSILYYLTNSSKGTAFFEREIYGHALLVILM